MTESREEYMNNNEIISRSSSSSPSSASESSLSSNSSSASSHLARLIRENKHNHNNNNNRHSSTIEMEMNIEHQPVNRYKKRRYNNVLDWTRDDIAAWLIDIRKREYVINFMRIAKDINLNGVGLKQIDNEDLKKEFEIADFQDRHYILNEIRKLH